MVNDSHIGGGDQARLFETLTIRNEKEAWDALTRLATETQESDRENQQYKLVIDGWSGLNLHLRGDKFHSSLTPAVMEAYSDFQTGIFRAYALLKHGTENVNVLTHEERRELQLVLRVGNGTSWLNLDLNDCIKHFLKKCGEEVKPWHVIVTILSLGVMYFGEAAWRDYLQNRVDLRKMETSSKEMKDVLQHLEYAGDQENERLNIVAGLAQGNPVIESVVRNSETAHRSLLKGIASADAAEFDDTIITAPVARELARNARQQPQETRMDGSYRIVRVNSGSDKGFLINVKSLDSGWTLTAQLDADFPLSPEQKAILQAAEWEKRPVRLQINARKIGGRIISATITGVSVYEQETPPEPQRSDSKE